MNGQALRLRNSLLEYIFCLLQFRQLNYESPRVEYYRCCGMLFKRAPRNHDSRPTNRCSRSAVQMHLIVSLSISEPHPLVLVSFLADEDDDDHKCNWSGDHYNSIKFHSPRTALWKQINVKWVTRRKGKVGQPATQPALVFVVEWVCIQRAISSTLCSKFHDFAIAKKRCDYLYKCESLGDHSTAAVAIAVYHLGVCRNARESSSHIPSRFSV